MVSALGQNLRDLRDFSAIKTGPWPVTAELIEIVVVQYTCLEAHARMCQGGDQIFTFFGPWHSATGRKVGPADVWGPLIVP